MVKEDVPFLCLLVILIDSIFKMGKSNNQQALLVE